MVAMHGLGCAERNSSSCLLKHLTTTPPAHQGRCRAVRGVSTAVVSYVVNQGPRRVAPETPPSTSCNRDP
jgi:hypothetical protein